MPISKQLKVIRKKIERVKIEESANAVIRLLQRAGPYTVSKKALFQQVPHEIHCGRRKDGSRYIPTVENREVDIANAQFLRGHWKEIRLTCETYGYFIIWNPPGETSGVRLGTIEEYQQQQGLILSIASGFAEFHNTRADIIEDYGEKGTDIEVKIHRRKPR